MNHVIDSGGSRNRDSRKGKHRVPSMKIPALVLVRRERTPVLNGDNIGIALHTALKKWTNAMNPVDSFEKMLASGKDSPLLRFSLGSEYLKVNSPARAVEHLRTAVTLDAGYSAAWKLLGKALVQTGNIDAARDAYATGIGAATKNGDKQAAREMTVFLKRLERTS